MIRLQTTDGGWSTALTAKTSDVLAELKLGQPIEVVPGAPSRLAEFVNPAQVTRVVVLNDGADS